jgi:hypothetical protein
MKTFAFVLIFLATCAVTLRAQSGEPVRLFGQQEIAFAQTSFDFNAQGIGMPNCINIPLINRTDRPRLLTALRSNNSAFTISSPAEEMLPIEIQPGGTMFVNICFRPMKEMSYAAKISAVFGTDSSELAVLGGGIKVEPIKIPAKDDLRVSRKKDSKTEFVFEVDLARSSAIELTVSDALGTPLKSFTYGEIKQAGPYRFTFNGRDSNGRPLEKGKYYVKLATMDFKATKIFEVTSVPLREKKRAANPAQAH